jgi:nucleoside-diphosphate-sugar epimerase
VDVAEAIRNVLGFRGEIHARFPPGYPARPVVEPYLSLDAAKARRDLRWAPRVPLREGLARTIAAWKAAD